MFKLKNKTRRQAQHDKAEIENVPVHVAIIPDGNRRWAKLHRLPVKAGHKEGSYTLKKIVKEAHRHGIKYITFYAFSTENWTRDKKEVNSLMNLMLEFMKNAEKEIAGDNIVIKVIGDRSGLSLELQEQIIRVEKLTRVNNGIILYLAINYGGRDEIINAAKSIARSVDKGEIGINKIDEKLFGERLYTKDYPDPDLLIRTSGEQRISNFLLYQLAYTEFYFSEKLWPDFDENEFRIALISYQERTRKFGAGGTQ